jgi:hypothetical protein
MDSMDGACTQRRITIVAHESKTWMDGWMDGALTDENSEKQGLYAWEHDPVVPAYKVDLRHHD